MSKTTYKYLPKWRLAKFYHDKMMIELKEAKSEDVEIEEKTEEQEQKKIMDKFNDPNWLYDNHLITYEELIKSKKNDL